MNSKLGPGLEGLLGSNNKFEDGTNILAGTRFWEEPGTRVLPWYVPAKAKAARQWGHNITKLRNRFEHLIDECRPADCILLQWRIPMVESALPRLPMVPQYCQLIWAGPGVSREPAKLLGQDWKPVEGAFAINSVKGEPILGPDASRSATGSAFTATTPSTPLSRILAPCPFPNFQNYSTKVETCSTNFLQMSPPPSGGFGPTAFHRDSAQARASGSTCSSNSPGSAPMAAPPTRNAKPWLRTSP